MFRKGPAMLQLKSSAAGAVLLLSLLLSGCLPREPLPYSPNYSSVTLVDESKAAEPGAVHKVQARRTRQQATTVGVPDACITPDVTEQPLYLPPGCANNLNLQMMLERPKDLVQGRQPGPAAAAPTVRAAQRYLYEGTEAERRTGGKSDQSKRERPTTPPPTQPGARIDGN
jgi:hypothetical protein